MMLSTRVWSVMGLFGSFVLIALVLSDPGLRAAAPASRVLALPAGCTTYNSMDTPLGTTYQALP